MSDHEYLLSLAAIAELAQVQRPVVTTWRTRPASSPFPEPVHARSGAELFVAEDVATWLERTGRGNNPAPRSDVMRYARPASLEQVAGLPAVLEALLCVVKMAPERLSELTPEDVRGLADELDPDDECLYSEVQRAGDRSPAILRYLRRLVDAVYGFQDALSVLDERSSSGWRDAGLLAAPGKELLGELAAAIALDVSASSLILDDVEGKSTEIVTAAVAGLRERLEIGVLVSGVDAAARSARRRHLIWGSGAALDVDPSKRLVVVNLQGRDGAPEAGDALDAIDGLQLEQTDEDHVMIVGPAAVLCDGLPNVEQAQRAEVLRLGRVRLIAKLPTGLLVQRPRQHLGVWLLGPEADGRPIEERATMTADLSDVRVTTDVISRLATDSVAALESRQPLHAFSFAQQRKLSDVLAARGPVVPPGSRPARAVVAAMDEVIALDGLLRAAGCGSEVQLAPQTCSPGQYVTVGAALSDGVLDVIPGVRLSSEPLDAGQLRLITAGVVTDQAEPLKVDPLSLERQVASTRRTEPGDVIFVTSPRPRAMVDRDGMAVVAYPARVLRPRLGSGLVGGAIAGAINALGEHAKEWRGWLVPRLSPSTTDDVAAVLNFLDDHESALRRQLNAVQAARSKVAEVAVCGAARATLSSSLTHHKHDIRLSGERKVS